jgi:mRNA interferase RelE/StbE
MGSNVPNYRIQIKRAATRALRRLPKDLVARLQQAIDALAINPRPHDCKRMKSNEELYRLRVGDWRIIYTIVDDELFVLVVDIGSRGSIYRDY